MTDTQTIQEPKIKDLVFKSETFCEGENTLHFCNLPEGRISILDRKTGYSGCFYNFPSRDIETGYRNAEDTAFWLASGNFDIRTYPELTISEAIAFIKERANTCKGE